jgi:hypothetical protein
MEIARLTAICRKSDCGPLENEIVRLRQQIRTLEESKTGDSESEAEEEVENEVENAALHYAEGELARVKAEPEEQEKGNADLDSKHVNLQSKNDDLEIEVPKPKSELAYRKCEMCVEHEGKYKWLSAVSHCQTDTTRSWTRTCSSTSR